MYKDEEFWDEDYYITNVRDGEPDDDYDTFERETSDFDEDLDDDLMDELEFAGLDYDELSFMDEDERNECLRDAGLDPDDYNFD